jgi:hypothetical protein
MNRRSFLSTLCVSAALLFTGCKSGDPAPAAAHNCACSPDGKCACAECAKGDMAKCTCEAPKDGAASKPQ